MVGFGGAGAASSLRLNWFMTFAAYNAGRGSVKKWIERYGDPRDPKVDAVDWVELIPFSETRNYVQRIMRNQRCRERGGNLWQRERPDRQLLIQIVSVCATYKPRSRPFAAQQGRDDARNKQKIIENPEHELDRINQKAGNDKEDRNKQRLAEKLKLCAGWRFAH